MTLAAKEPATAYSLRHPSASSKNEAVLTESANSRLVADSETITYRQTSGGQRSGGCSVTLGHRACASFRSRYGVLSQNQTSGAYRGFHFHGYCVRPMGVKPSLWTGQSTPNRTATNTRPSAAEEAHSQWLTGEVRGCRYEIKAMVISLANMTASSRPAEAPFEFES